MSLMQDLRFGGRMFIKNPGFTAVVVVALALGIGANTTVFTLVNAVLFKGLPFHDADRVMYLYCNNPSRGDDHSGVSYPDFRDLRAQAKSFQDLAAISMMTANLSDGSNVPERYLAARMSVNSFSLIGQPVSLGRDFAPGEDRPDAQPVAIIGYSVWRDRYSSDARILGRTVRINDVATTIIGVMPKGMKFPLNQDLWIPLIPTKGEDKRDARGFGVFGRLAHGVTLTQARAEIDLLAKRIQNAYAKTNAGVGVVVRPYNEEFNGGSIRLVFLALLGAVGFVLLIACANVANLLLSRSVSRTREVSIRTAMGATRWRVVRQLLVESVLLGLAGGAAGLLVALWGAHMFDLAVAGVDKPYWIDFSLDYRVFGYLTAVCLATGLLFGMAPALAVSRVDINETLKEGSRGNSGGARARYFSFALVAGEFALALVLLVAAGLMIRSFLKMYGMDLGVDTANLLVMRFDLPDAKYPAPSDRVRFAERLRPLLNSVPGVEAAALASHFPLGGSNGWRFEIEGDRALEPDKRPEARGLIVSPEYFRVMGMPMRRGRLFDETDGQPGKTVVIVNQSLAAKYWPRQDPVGKRMRLAQGDQQQPWLTVIGVCPLVRQNDPNRPDLEPLIYIPYRQDPTGYLAIVARARVSPGSLVAAFRRTVQSADPNLPVYDAWTMQEFLARRRWPFRVFGSMFAIFAVIALLMASVGIYAVMAYSVSQRTQEIGVRVALGATRGSILWLTLAHGIRQIAVGLAVGVAAAFALTRVLSTLLVQVTATDPLTFSAIPVVLTAVALFACWMPARRATKIDPVVALRYE